MGVESETIAKPAESQPNGIRSPTWYRRGVTIALAGYWSALFVSTHTPMPDLGDLPENSDKVMHFVAYAGLSFLLGWRWSLNAAFTPALAARVFGITAVYAAVDELLQTIPMLNRTGDVLDALADCCGSLIGLALLYAFLKLTRRWQPAAHRGSV